MTGVAFPAVAAVRVTNVADETLRVRAPWLCALVAARLDMSSFPVSLDELHGRELARLVAGLGLIVGRLYAVRADAGGGARQPVSISALSPMLPRCLAEEIGKAMLMKRLHRAHDPVCRTKGIFLRDDDAGPTALIRHRQPGIRKAHRWACLPAAGKCQPPRRTRRGLARHGSGWARRSRSNGRLARLRS